MHFSHVFQLSGSAAVYIYLYVHITYNIYTYIVKSNQSRSYLTNVRARSNVYTIIRILRYFLRRKYLTPNIRVRGRKIRDNYTADTRI